MKLLVGVVLLCFAVAAYAAPRIVGGKDAPEGVYKYQVSLRRIKSLQHFCGGSIINKRWILTAAHCLVGKENEPLMVVAGTNLISGGKGQTYESEYIVAHKGFSFSGLANDIGLIRVSEDIQFNDKVQPIDLPKKEFYEVGQQVKLTGWGRIRAGGPVPNKLQEIDLKVHDQELCKKQMKFIAPITISHICTLTKSGEGACHGDSGGPLAADNVQIGVVSFGSPCARGLPDVFTRVHTFLDWIASEQAKF